MNDVKQKDRLVSRAFSIKTSIRTRMLQIASELNEAIPLGRGNPDFDSPSTIIEAGNRHVRITLLSPQSIISKTLERMKDFLNNL